MGKEIIAVYQDCVLCGVHGRQKISELAQKGIIVRKVGFTTPEGQELIHEAIVEHKIGSMPFYTDGKKFSISLEDFIEKTAKNVKKTKKTEKEGKDGTI